MAQVAVSDGNLHTHDVATLLREYLDYIHIRNNKELDIEENLI